MIKLYGLKNCDGCKKALRWCLDHGIEADIHDLRRDGVSQRQIQNWLSSVGVDGLVNRRGTTWRQLSEDLRAQVEDPKTAAVTIAAHIALIKRPVVEAEAQVFVGFSDALKAHLAGS
jgi:arsenate reductase